MLTVAGCAGRMRAAFASRPWVKPIVMRRSEDLPAAFETLRSLGIERVSAVGGRGVATQLIDAGLVQNVYLTTSPRPGGDPGTPMYPRPLNARALVRKHGTAHESGVIFEHLTIRDSST